MSAETRPRVGEDGRDEPGSSHNLTAEHVSQVLGPRAIPAEFAAAHGVLSIATAADLPDGCPDYWTTASGCLPALLFPWRSVDGQTEWQLRPDVPPVDKQDRPRKYVFRKGARSVLALVGEHKPDGLMLIVEGTCQSLAAGAYAPDGVTVLGIAGCHQWSQDGVPLADLAVTTGRDVVIVLDADAATNRAVYDAGTGLAEACAAAGAESVHFVRVPGGKKAGLDDVLGAQDEIERRAYLARLIASAKTKPADAKPKPPRKRDEQPASPFFDDSGRLLAQQTAEAIMAQRPAALTREDKIALYDHGVYERDEAALTAAVTEALGDDYRKAHRGTIEDVIVGSLHRAGLLLPERSDGPVLNVSNGMLNLRTGELLPHDPAYLSSAQFPVPYYAGAVCPTYDRWAMDSVGDQLDDLEESVAAMLDPSSTPTKAVFLFGPSRSGKSTFLRLMSAMAGESNISAVSLHQLNEDRFAAANVYGKVLNVSADLKSSHVDDLSVFKMMTGEDVITGNRKFGAQFAFTNRALFAFSANALPTVGESSRAYSERMSPFLFGRSFAGHEDHTLETRLRAELPGILARWVRAWQRRAARGVPLETDAHVRELFEQASDRVRAFVASACHVHDADTARLPAGQVTTVTVMHRKFLEWAEIQGGARMNQSTFRDRLTTIPGVRELRSTASVRGFNVTVLPPGKWGQGAGLPSLPPRASRATPTHSPEDEDCSFSVKAGEKEVCFQDEGEWVEPARPAHGGPAAAHPTTPFDDLFELYVDRSKIPVATCPDCDAVLDLVPDTYFWHACRSCHPATFERG